jgi:glycosyltransferase involved in cell wall biosynthesis
LKVLEALACSIPIVSTTLGVEGIKVIPGQSVLIADSSESFAQSIIELLSNNIKRERLSQNGLSVLINDYSFEVNTNRIQKIVDELIC